MRRQIEIGEEPDRTLAELAERSEEAQRAELQAQVERAERGFREGQSIPWEQLKRRNGLGQGVEISLDAARRSA